jgi:hypothetical protein
MRWRNLLNCLLVVFCTFISTGCQSAMNTNAAAKNPISNQDVSRPFTFSAHNIGVHCFNTYGCKVYYAGTYEVMDDDNKLAPPPKKNNSYQTLVADHIGIPNFPPPAKISWRSKDGKAHSAEIDIGEIFKDQIIRHNVAKEDLPTETVAGSDFPDIILVVDDRTISVLMRATIYLKDTPARKRAVQEEAILSFSKTY